MKITNPVFLIIILSVFFSFLIFPVYSENSGIKDLAPPPGTQPVYFLSGSPYEMGYQYGCQASEPILITRNATLAQVLKRYPKETLDQILDRYNESMVKEVPEFDVRSFIQGIADGANTSGDSISYRDIVMLHNQIALLYYPNITDNGMCTLFSVFRNDTPPLAAVNYDMQNGLAVAYFGTIVAYPDNGIPFITSANAGKLTSSSGMNAKGVVIGAAKAMKINKENTTTYSVNSALSIPALLMTRSTAKTSAERMLSMPVPFGLNHLITDSTGDAYVVEKTPNLTGVRRAGDNGENEYLVVTNHFLTPIMKRVQKPWDPKIGYPSSYFRYVTAEALITNQSDTLNVSASELILSNTSYYNGSTWIYQVPFSGNTINRFESFSGTLQSEIFDLVNKTLYICSGNPKAPQYNRLAPEQTGEYVKIPLRSSPEETVKEIRNAALEQIQRLVIKIGDITKNNSYDAYVINNNFDRVKTEFWKAEMIMSDISGVENKTQRMMLLGEAASIYAKVQAQSQYIRHSSEGMRDVPVFYPLPAN